MARPMIVNDDARVLAEIRARATPRCVPCPQLLWAVRLAGGRNEVNRNGGADGTPSARRRARVNGPSAELVADHRDEREHLAGVAAEIVCHGEAAVGRGDLALLRRLLAQLQPALEEHAQARGADRVPEGLQPAVGIDRELAVEVERPGQDLLPCRAPRREPGPPSAPARSA